MRNVLKQTIGVLGVLSWTALAYGQAGSGSMWELTMQMAGMPAGMLPKQTACMSNDENEAPPQEKECTVLEARSTGNHHQIKAQCKEGLVEIDHTRTATTLTQRMKMTDKRGEVTEMTMTGRRLQDCDYAATRKAQAAQVAAIEQQVGDMQLQSNAQMAKVCGASLDAMDGTMLMSTDVCPKERKDFCSRLNTFDGYAKAGSRSVAALAADPKLGLPAHARSCGLDNEALRVKFCTQAAGGSSQLGFISNQCPAERTALVAQHCAGRSYSNQAAPEYREFCSANMTADTGSDGVVADVAAPQKPVAAPKPADEVKKRLGRVFGR